MRAWMHQAIALVSMICLTFEASFAQSGARAPTAAASGEAKAVAKANEWTVGLASGTPSGTFMRFGAEIAGNINQVGDMRVLAVITPGATENVRDLLYLRGIDIAITHADVL